MGLSVQYSIELTYPQSVPIMIGVHSLIQRAMMLVTTNIGQALISHPNLENGALITNIIYCCLLGIVIIIQIAIKEKLNREEADRVVNYTISTVANYFNNPAEIADE